MAVLEEAIIVVDKEANVTYFTHIHTCSNLSTHQAAVLEVAIVEAKEANVAYFHTYSHMFELIHT